MPRLPDGLALSLDLALEPSLETLGATDASSGATLPERNRGDGWALGVEGSWMTGIAPAGLPGIGAFVDWAPSDPGASLRFTGRGSRTSGAVSANVDVEVTQLAGRDEGCPLHWALGDVSVRPCLGFELGVLRASSTHRVGRADSGAWASGVGIARGVWRPVEPFSLEVGLGALVPFVRYDLGAVAGESLYRTQPIALEASLGTAWRWP